MKIVFLSNYFNHHQKPLSDELFCVTNGNYIFVATEKMSEERKNMGWGEINTPEYVRQYDEEKDVLDGVINDADVVIIGSAPMRMVSSRLKAKKLTFIYSERIYKEKIPYFKLPLHFLKFGRRYRRHKSLYLLCASAYTASDYARTFTFINKAYKWGYFPECKEYENIDDLIVSKKKNSLLWCARFIDLKHPEIPVRIAKRLRDDGYDFELNMIGVGEMQNDIRNMVDNLGVSDNVHFLGSMSPERVREYMEKSEIFLFTSDRNEGWGAVLNESMNSACAVVANQAIGSVPFLVKNGENGFTYEDSDEDELYSKIRLLLDNEKTRLEISKNAYLTIKEEWNAENASSKFLYLCNKIFSGEKISDLYNVGVCSNAKK